MKKLLICVALLSASEVSAKGEVTEGVSESMAAPAHSYEVKANVLSAILGTFSGTFEIALSENMTLGPTVYIGSPLGSAAYGDHFWAGAGPRFSYYFAGERAKGAFFVNGRAELGALKGKYSSVILGELGGDFGYHWVFAKGFVVATSLGLTHTRVFAEGGGGLMSGGFVLPRLAAEIGYAF